MPIASNIQLDNFIMLPINLELYEQKAYHVAQSPSSNKTKSRSLKNNIKLLQFFSHIDSIIESNIFDNTIEQLNKKEYKLNIIIRKKKTKINLAKYLYAAYLYLANHNFSIWLGLTSQLILKYLSKSIYTYQE